VGQARRRRRQARERGRVTKTRGSASRRDRRTGSMRCSRSSDDLRLPHVGADIDGGDGGHFPERAAGVERLAAIGAGPTHAASVATCRGPRPRTSSTPVPTRWRSRSPSRSVANTMIASLTAPKGYRLRNRLIRAYRAAGPGYLKRSRRARGSRGHCRGCERLARGGRYFRAPKSS
jgi:hypothetical protein